MRNQALPQIPNWPSAPGLSLGDVSKILVISYLFPPSGGVGIARTVGYAKYFPRHAETYVLAPSNAGTPVQDYSLLELIPPETTVVRAFSPAIPYAFRDRVWKRIVGPANGDRKSVV